MIKASAIIMLLAFVGDISFSQVGGTDQLRDSLKHELAIAKDDTSRVLIMADLANAYSIHNSDSVNRYGNQALALAQKIQFSRGEVSALNALGNFFQLQGDYPKSLEYLYRGLQIAKDKHYVFEIAVCFNWIGAAYWFLADYLRAVDFYNKSYNLFEITINKPGTAEWIKLNILSSAQAYLDWNHLDSAYHYLQRYLNAAQHDDYWYPTALYLFGDCLFKRGNRDTAFDYVRESIAGLAAIGDYFTQAEACAVISGFFKTTQHPDSTIYYAKKGLAAADSIAYGLGIYKNSKLLAEAYELSNVQEALHYRKVYDSVNERMYGAKKVQALQKTLAEEQQRQQQIQDEQIARENRLKQYGFITGLSIMLLIAFILYRNNRHKQKAYALLEKQKREIDFQKTKVEATLDDLKSAQAQLIQSEKMASLGEVTAGIAHEIQNPLNFVNNFSEVSDELLEEMVKELEQENIGEAKAIAADIKQNLLKINQHGKRAESIVKGMLEHSRTNKGEKQATDINTLANEYLRLAYHGILAKDKSFNADIKISFDKSIGKVHIVPQDIGRVLLNIYNNAFYALYEKKSKLNVTFEPVVSVTTERHDGSILIKIKDNGIGIPQNIINKIFQPFFTTKPTGQGTGLGLSLSYDIIKAHGGAIAVDSKEGEGTEFIISLPG